MGESTREHKLGIQVMFLVVYIFKETNKSQTVSHTGCEITGQISMLPEGSVRGQDHMMLTKGHLTEQQRLSAGKTSPDMGIAHICTGENVIKGE